MYHLRPQIYKLVGNSTAYYVSIKVLKDSSLSRRKTVSQIQEPKQYVLNPIISFANAKTGGGSGESYYGALGQLVYVLQLLLLTLSRVDAIKINKFGRLLHLSAGS